MSFGDRLKAFFSSRNVVWMLGLTLVIGSIIYFTGNTSGTKFKGNLIAEEAPVQTQEEVQPEEAETQPETQIETQEENLVAVEEVGDDAAAEEDDGFSDDAIITQELQSPDEQASDPNADQVMVAVSDEKSSYEEEAITEDNQGESQGEVVEDLDAAQVLEEIPEESAETQEGAVEPQEEFGGEAVSEEIAMNVEEVPAEQEFISEAEENILPEEVGVSDLSANMFVDEGSIGQSNVEPQPEIKTETQQSVKANYSSPVKKAVKKAAPKYSNTVKTGPETILYLLIGIASLGPILLIRKKQN